MFKRAKVIAALAGASSVLVLAFAGSASAAPVPAPTLKLGAVTLKDGAITVSLNYSCAAGSVDEIWLKAGQVVVLGDDGDDSFYVWGARTVTRKDRPKLTCDGKSYNLRIGLVARDGDFHSALTDVEGELWTSGPVGSAEAAKTVLL
jgi:hypothetical protein